VALSFPSLWFDNEALSSQHLLYRNCFPPFPSGRSLDVLVFDSCKPKMANFLVDPRLHLPTGFSIVDVPRDELLHRMSAFLGLSMEWRFEKVVIANFFPRVAKEDFRPMARGMFLHLLAVHKVDNVEIHPYPDW
jgi:hypothetical protein